MRFGTGFARLAGVAYRRAGPGGWCDPGQRRISDRGQMPYGLPGGNVAHGLAPGRRAASALPISWNNRTLRFL
ncbi:hypothetical protein GCM10010126_51950 [Planomonospora parontospora]|uniref:Uncharacterized protein n=1 Tax=Planomonospora parontospora TaxID=58119 RepID=A0AA37F729_9ACTN|nr:hypothetical protein GCM10010126_51950 [Planomonospora parontospora]